jgi:hypothetical protein
MARVRTRARGSSSKTPNRMACDPEEGEAAIVKLLAAAGAAGFSKACDEALVGFFAGGIADEFIVFGELGRRTNHLPHIEIGRLQVEA